MNREVHVLSEYDFFLTGSEESLIASLSVTDFFSLHQNISGDEEYIEIITILVTNCLFL